MSSYIGKHDALAKVCGVSDTKSNPLISFVDVEGQGAEDGTYDTMLALPLLLTSKVRCVCFLFTGISSLLTTAPLAGGSVQSQGRAHRQVCPTPMCGLR